MVNGAKTAKHGCYFCGGDVFDEDNGATFVLGNKNTAYLCADCTTNQRFVRLVLSYDAKPATIAATYGNMQPKKDVISKANADSKQWQRGIYLIATADTREFNMDWQYTKTWVHVVATYHHQSITLVHVPVFRDADGHMWTAETNLLNRPIALAEWFSRYGWPIS